jgi:hypothetical protein
MGLKFSTHDKDVFGSWSRAHLKGLSPVLKEWINVVSTYSESFKGDACYLYNERTSVGMLAAAAWRKNWVALEEFLTRKVNRDAECDDAHGRCDLKIASMSTSYAIEAKHVWQPIGSRVSNDWQQVNRKRVAAKKDAQVITRDQATHRLSAVFISPRLKASDVLSASNQKVAVTELIDQWLAGIDKLPAVHAFAYIFPWRNRLLLRGSQEQYIWPGTVLLIRETKRVQR